MKFLLALLIFSSTYPLAFAHRHEAAAHDHHDHSAHQCNYQEMKHEPRVHKHHHRKMHKKMMRAVPQEVVAYNIGKSNQAEIMVTDSIKHRLHNKDLQKFAKTVITAHRENQMLRNRIIKEEGILPAQNKMGLKTRQDAMVSAEALMGVTPGSDLDRAFLAKTISMHRKSLYMLDKKYIPSARNLKWKEYLIATRSHVAAHLEEAERIRMNYDM